MRDRKRDTDVSNSLLDSVGEGEGGMIWENGIETCILSYVKQTVIPDSMHETGCSGLVPGRSLWFAEPPSFALGTQNQDLFSFFSFLFF